MSKITFQLRDHLPSILGICLLLFVPALPGINGMAIHYGDEAFYMEWSEKVSFPDNFAIRTFKDNLHFHKPPAFNWAVAICYELFGVSLFSARLPSILAGCGVAILTYLLGFYCTGSKKTALYSGLAIVSSYLFYTHSRMALTDVAMTLGITAGAFGFLVGTDRWENGKSPHFSFLLGSIGIGLSGLVKGHVGTVLGILPVACFFLFRRIRGGKIPFKALLMPTAWLPAVIMCGWWYAYLLTNSTLAVTVAPAHTPVEQTIREAFLEYFREKETQGRTSGGLHRIIVNIFAYTLGYARAFAPWSLIAFAGAWWWNRPIKEFLSKKSNAVIMLYCMVVPLTLFFCFVILQQVRLRYLLPTTPAIAVLAGIALTRIDELNKWRSRWLKPLPLAIILLTSFNLFLVGGKNLFFKEPAEAVSERLRPLLKSDDVVWLFDNDWDLSVYTRSMLGHPVNFARANQAAETISMSLTNPLIRTIFLISDQELQKLPAEVRAKLVILAEDTRIQIPGHGRDFRKAWDDKALPRETYLAVSTRG